MAGPWEKYAAPAAEDAPLKPILNERAAAQAVAFSPEEQAANAAQEGRLRESNLAALDLAIKRAPDAKIRGELEAERETVLKSVPAAPGAPWERYSQPQGPAAAPLKIGREAFQEDLRNAVQGAGGWDRFWAAAGTALHDPLLRVTQMVQGGQLSPSQQAQVEANRELAAGSTAGRIAGDIGLLAVPGGAVQRGIARSADVLGMLPRAAGITNPIVNAAARAVPPTLAAGGTGALLASGTTPTLPGESEASVAGYGALGGFGGDVASRVAARVAQPITQSPAVQEMLRKGIVPTIGQAFGPRSVVNATEQRLASLPVIGWFTKGARDRATAEMNVNRIQEAVPPAYRGEIARAGRESVEKAKGIMDDAYDAIYAQIKNPVALDKQFFFQAAGKIPNQPMINLTETQTREFDKAINDIVYSRISGRSLDAQTLREIHNDLGQEARDFLKSQSTREQRLGRAFEEAKDAFRAMVSRQASGDFKASMAALDKTYANLQVVKRASEATGSKEGIFSAERLRQEAKRGPAEMRDFSRTAGDVLGGTEPDSGTAGRMITAALLGAGGLSSANEYFGGPGYITAALAAPLLYSRIGSRYALGDFPLQARIAQGLRGLGPAATIAGQSIATP